MEQTSTGVFIAAELPAKKQRFLISSILLRDNNYVISLLLFSMLSSSHK